MRLKLFKLHQGAVLVEAKLALPHLVILLGLVVVEIEVHDVQTGVALQMNQDIYEPELGA